jgi:hypothetical protein
MEFQRSRKLTRKRINHVIIFVSKNEQIKPLEVHVKLQKNRIVFFIEFADKNSFCKKN